MKKKPIKAVRGWVIIRKGGKRPWGNVLGQYDVYAWSNKPTVNKDYDVIPVLITPLNK